MDTDEGPVGWFSGDLPDSPWHRASPHQSPSSTGRTTELVAGHRPLPLEQSGLATPNVRVRRLRHHSPGAGEASRALLAGQACNAASSADEGASASLREPSASAEPGIAIRRRRVSGKSAPSGEVSFLQRVQRFFARRSEPDAAETLDESRMWPRLREFVRARYRADVADGGQPKPVGFADLSAAGRKVAINHQWSSLPDLERAEYLSSLLRMGAVPAQFVSLATKRSFCWEGPD